MTVNFLVTPMMSCCFTVPPELLFVSEILCCILIVSIAVSEFFIRSYPSSVFARQFGFA